MTYRPNVGDEVKVTTKDNAPRALVLDTPGADGDDLIRYLEGDNAGSEDELRAEDMAHVDMPRGDSST